MSEFAGKLIIQNCENSNLNCTQCMCRMSGFAEKFEYLEPPKFNEKLCTLHMYGMSGLA